MVSELNQGLSLMLRGRGDRLSFFNGPDWHKLSARRQLESVKGGFRAEVAEILKSSLFDLCANQIAN
ncbi:hypothetical protein CDQ92_02945 [Sphingopyxis bauzanensis]|uniref:Uncharacterized protein n=1 Tax=Sphingopyxis bauzanensis TaxID=651663 RepID=A0A246K1A8_9SPHN|nr:hypothetical protein CDQ92_02945 [Sphingopyxis bauzanensis]